MKNNSQKPSSARKVSRLPARWWNNNRGEAFLLAIIALISLVGSMVGVLKLQDLAYNTEEVQRRMADIQSEMKAVITRASIEGRLTQAQADMAKHRIDRNWHLFKKLGERIVERQVDIFDTQQCYVAADMIFNVLGLGADVAAGAFKAAKALRDLAKPVLLTGHFGTTAIAFKEATAVNVSDLKEPIAAIRQVWNEPVNDFQKAMVVAKIRIFWDKLQSLELSKERRKEVFRTFIKGLQKQGWVVDGVNFKSKRSIALFAIQEMKKYKREKISKPGLSVYQVTAKPDKVKPGQTVTLEGRVVVQGLAEGDLDAGFVVGGVPVTTRLIVTGRIDVPATAISRYTVPEDLEAGEYEVELKSELKLPQETLRASAKTSFEVFSEKGAIPKDLFVGKWSGVERVRENNTLTAEEIKAEGLSTTSPLSFTVKKSGNSYTVSGIPLLTVKRVSVKGNKLTIIADGSYDSRYLKFDSEQFTLTLQDEGRMLAGTHRIDFAAPDKAPVEYRDYQINEVKLHKQ
jgi:hypothetical protein